jgi:signal peptidase I
MALAMGALAAFAAGRWWRAAIFAVDVAGDSMTPALEDGDWLLIRRGAPPQGDRAFGLVVTARAPEGRLLLKRVVGLPGETVQVEGGALRIDGRRLEESYATGETLASPFRNLTRLGPDDYYLVGDHREASTDSRDVGPFARERVDGVALVRYWPPRRLGRLRAPSRQFSAGDDSGHHHDHGASTPRGPVPLRPAEAGEPA